MYRRVLVKQEPMRVKLSVDRSPVSDFLFVYVWVSVGGSPRDA